MRVSVRIEGDPTAATPLILELSDAVSRALRAAAEQQKPVIKAPPSAVAARAALPDAAPVIAEPPQPAQAAAAAPPELTTAQPTTQPVTTAPAQLNEQAPVALFAVESPVGSEAPQPAPSASVQAVEAPAQPEMPSEAQPAPPAPVEPPSRSIFARLGAVFGVLLLAVGIAAPLIAPVEARRDMLPITVLCGTVGVLLLFSSVLSPASSAPKAAPEPRRAAPARAALVYRRGRSPLQTALGLLVGGAFVVAGLTAPVLLGASTADERFLLMIGFAPVTVIGFFLIAIYGNFLARRTPAPAGATAGAPRAAAPRSARAPQMGAEYRAFVPLATVSLLVLMIAVLVLVLIGNVVTALR